MTISPRLIISNMFRQSFQTPQPAPTAPAAAAPAKVETNIQLEFSAPPTFNIPFATLEASLKQGSADRDKLIKADGKGLLQGGSGAATASAAYFAWQRAVVTTNDTPNNTPVTYVATLDDTGRKSGPVKMDPEGTDEATVEEKAGGLFDTRGNLNVQVPNAVYINTADGNKKYDYNTLRLQIFPQYRVWAVPQGGSEARLLLPDRKVPDQSMGTYAGGERALFGFTGGEEPEEAAAPVQPGQTGQKKSPFKAVDEGEHAPVKGDTIPKGPKVPAPATAKMAHKSTEKRKPGDYASVPYSGGSDVVQRLFYDQEKKMDIRGMRKMAQRVVLGFVSQTQTSPATVPSTTPTAKKMVEFTPESGPDQPPEVQQVDINLDRVKNQKERERLQAIKQLQKAQDALSQASKGTPAKLMGKEALVGGVKETPQLSEKNKELQDAVERAQEQVDKKSKDLASLAKRRVIKNKGMNVYNIAVRKFQGIPKGTVTPIK